MKQVVYAMFITNIHSSFHLWLKENLVKHQNVSEYYDHGSFQNVLLLFISLLTAPIFKNSHILAVIYFIFLKICRELNLKDFQYQISTSVKNWRSSYQVGQILALFCKLVALILG